MGQMTEFEIMKSSVNVLRHQEGPETNLYICHPRDDSAVAKVAIYILLKIVILILNVRTWPVAVCKYGWVIYRA